MEQSDTQRGYITKLVEQLQKAEKEALKEKKQATLGRTKKGTTQLFFKSLATPNSSEAVLLPIKWQDVDKTLEEKQKKLGHQTKATTTDSHSHQTNTIPRDPSVVSTLPQRLRQSSQSREVTELLPRRKHLLTRISKKCKVCDKALVKPDISPAKVAFSRKHIALLYVPVVTLVPTKLFLKQAGSLLFKITNPLQSQSQMKLTFGVS